MPFRFPLSILSAICGKIPPPSLSFHFPRSHFAKGYLLSIRFAIFRHMVFYVVILFLCAGSSIPLAAMAWHRRPSRGALSLFFFLACIGWSCFAYAQNLMSPDLAGKQFWNHAEYLGGMFLTPLMLVLALVFTHREKWIRPIPMLLLFAIPVFTLLANWTNPWHHLYYTATWIDASGPLPVLAKSRGPLYAIKFLYAYAAAAFALVLLARSLRRADSATRPQLWLLLASFLLPLLLNAPYLLRLMPHKHVNLTLLGFVAASALISIAEPIACCIACNSRSTSSICELMLSCAKSVRERFS